jgi:hypothetical protein
MKSLHHKFCNNYIFKTYLVYFFYNFFVTIFIKQKIPFTLNPQKTNVRLPLSKLDHTFMFEPTCSH